MQEHRDGVLGLRIFIVEDDMLVALNLEDMLVDLGCSVLGPATRLDDARGMIGEDFAADVALLDVNVGGEPVFPVAEILAKKRIPIVFATGYDRGGLPEEWRDRTILQKPYSQEDVSRSLLKAVCATA